MPEIEVCLTPALLHLHELAGKVIVITDILRATTSITWGIENGADAIIPVSTINECLSYRAKGCLVAAERSGQVVPGFDFGNSPFSYTREKVEGKRIALTTTNGTKAINLSTRTDNTVIIGSFLNLQAVCDYVISAGKSVVVVCAGWKDQFNLEDTLFAGAVVAGTAKSLTAVEDAAIAARQLYNAASHNLLESLQDASHFKRLAALNIIEDIKFCLQRNICGSIPILKHGELVKM